MSKIVIYTVGHSTHPIEYFIELLSLHFVTCVIDVRSVPASRFNPQYNKKSLTDSLQQHGILYRHFPEEFGARQKAASLLNEEGQVDFEKMRNSEKFKAGLAQLLEVIAEGHVVSLMCAESEPLNCHRFSMICPALQEFEVKHILKDKSAIVHTQLEGHLLKLYSKKLPEPDIFNIEVSVQEQLKAAYKILNKKVAYSPLTH